MKINTKKIVYVVCIFYELSNLHLFSTFAACLLSIPPIPLCWAWPVITGGSKPGHEPLIVVIVTANTNTHNYHHNTAIK